MSKFLLPLSDYNRVYQVAHGVTRAFGRSEKNCIFFATFGAFIINKYYGIPARAIAGGFALRTNDADVILFGEDKAGQIIASPEGFHMWVQTETHVIDFMAPIFPEAIAEKNLSAPRYMFQRLILSEAANLDSLATIGDFYTFPSLELTELLLGNFLSRSSVGGLLFIADQWFGNHRRKQAQSIQMRDSEGEVRLLTLPQTTATGSW